MKFLILNIILTFGLLVAFRGHANEWTQDDADDFKQCMQDMLNNDVPVDEAQAICERL